MSTTPQFITRKQLAERWDVSIESLKRYERRGILTAVKIAPRVLRYRFSEIVAQEESATLNRSEASAGSGA